MIRRGWSSSQKSGTGVQRTLKDSLLLKVCQLQISPDVDGTRLWGTSVSPSVPWKP